MSQGEFGFDGSVLQVVIKGPYTAWKKKNIQHGKYYAVTKGRRFYPEFILCASSEILHSTGLLLSSVLWVKHAILERKKNPVNALSISVQLEYTVSKGLHS